MSTQDKRKCFTFTWKIENVICKWLKTGGAIRSSTFEINVPHKSKYYLALFLGNFWDENGIFIYLHRLEDHPLKKVDCELAFLSKDGAVLKSVEENNTSRTIVASLKIQRQEVFVNKSGYLPVDKIIIRCRIWRNDEEMTDVQYFACSRICIKKETFLWNIKNFSSLRPEEKCTYQIKSMSDNEVFITLDLLLKNPYTDEDNINVQLISENSKIKYCVLHLLPLNGFGSANEGIRKDFLFSDKNPKLLNLPFSKTDLLANKHLCLSNDVLSLRCECIFSTGDIIGESVIYNCESLAHVEPVNQCFDKENTLAVSKRNLNDDLKSLFHDNICSDIKLKASTKTFPAHKSILSARSLVFKALFSNNMKEKFTECVEIEDMDSDTLFRMLHYVYTAEIQDLQWESACELYRAADKYQILALREECSAYIKSNLCPNKACEVLILADMHQDTDLKSFVQEFIFNHDILHSEEWKHLMKTHEKLSAETMFLQIQRNLSCKFSAIELLFGKGSARINSVSSGFESITTKTTPTSLVLNSSTVNEPFQPFFLLDSSNENKLPSSDVFKTADERIPVSSPGLSYEKEGSPCASHNFKNNETDGFYIKASTGTTITFNPPTEEDTICKGGNSKSIWTKLQCITCMEEYKNKSFEELRVEDYMLYYGKGGNTVDTWGFGAATQQTSILNAPAISTFSFSYGGNQSGNFFRTIDTKTEFGMKSARTPTFPRFDNTTSRLNSSNIGIPSESKEFNFITSEKSSTSSLSICSTNEKEPCKTSFSFDEEKPSETTFSFGSGSKEVPVNSPSFFGNIGKIEKEPANIPFSFSSNSEKVFIKSIPFSSSNEKKSVKPSFFSFGNISEKEHVEPSVSSANRDKKIPVKPCSSYRNNSEKESVKSPFSFASSDEKESDKSYFSFGNSSEKESVKPPFSFASSDEKESDKSYFSFGNSSEKESGKSSFSFASNDEKESFIPCFSFASSDEKQHIEQSFASSDEKQHAEQSFGNNDEKQHVEQSFDNNEEKQHVEQSFDSSDEKQHVEQFFYSSVE